MVGSWAWTVLEYDAFVLRVSPPPVFHAPLGSGICVQKQVLRGYAGRRVLAGAGYLSAKI